MGKINDIIDDLVELRIQLKNQNNFYSSFAYGINWEVHSPGPDMGGSPARAWTDFKSICWDEEFFYECTKPERYGVAFHEILHIARRHDQVIESLKNHYGNEFDHRTANLALDAVINPALKNEGFTLPKNHYDEKRFHGLSEYEIYEILHEEKPETDLDWGFLDPDTNLNPQDEKVINSVIREAHKKSCGKGLGGLGSVFEEEYKEPKISWAQQIILAGQPSFRKKTSWARPNRKLIHAGIYAPGLHNKGSQDLYCFFYTSSSMSV